MQFSTLASLAFLGLAAASPIKRNDETTFGLVTIHSGSQFQYNSVMKVPSHPHVFAVGGTEGSAVVLTLKADGTLVDQDGKGIYINPPTGEIGNVDPYGISQPSSGFEIKDSHLVYQGKDSFYACPVGDSHWSLTNKDCTDGTGVALHVVSN